MYETRLVLKEHRDKSTEMPWKIARKNVENYAANFSVKMGISLTNIWIGQVVMMPDGQNIQL